MWFSIARIWHQIYNTRTNLNSQKIPIIIQIRIISIVYRVREL